MKRKVFFISDRTGITVEMMANSLLSQFDSVRFERETLPFVDDETKAMEAIAKINAVNHAEGSRPLVFSSLVDESLSSLISAQADAQVIDFFQAFIAPLENELGVKSSHAAGRSHGISNPREYFARIEAVNFTLAHDDGASTRELEKAQIILVGVSRCGKTPTSLYLAMQFGVRAANFPLTPEDFERGRMPESLNAFRQKLFGLTIAPERLQSIRDERRPDSTYSSLKNCRWEVAEAEKLLQRASIPYFDTSVKSIEEIAASVMLKAKIERHVF